MVDLNTTPSQSEHSLQVGKRSLSFVLLLAVSSFGQVTDARFGGGTGAPDDPYLIYTAEQLNEIGADSQNMNKHFKLMADIDLGGYTGTDFNIIGTSWSNLFSGVFDGNGKRIYNFTYTSEDRDSIGLFGFIRGENALIKNVGLINTNISAGEGDQIGSLVGRMDNGAAVRGCYARGGSVSGKNDVGGLVGDASEATITYSCSTASVSGRSSIGGLVGTYVVHVWASDDLRWRFGEPTTPVISTCYSAGSVSGRIFGGGLVGFNWGGIIFKCYSTGNVAGKDQSGWRFGGLVGNNHPGTIVNCYSTGNVSGDFEVGGLIGGSREGTITNCYSTGDVTGSRRVGGLMGSNSKGTVTACFWDQQKSGLSNMCGEQDSETGCEEGNAGTTTQLQTESTFLDAGWDFVDETENGTEDIWAICEGRNYPELTWQFKAGDFDGDNIVDLVDLAVFSKSWLSSDMSFFWCRGADITGDGEVGFDDLKELADNWLAEGIYNPAATVYLTIDDFESYNDLDPGDPASNRIFDVWADGYDNPFTNGSMVGHAFAPYAEQDIVYSGGQSMPYYYNALYKVARAELRLSPPQNWAETGAGALSLWFYGDSINGVTPMSVVINGGSTVYHENPEATRIEAWTEWIIELKEFTGADLASVSSIAICFGDPNNLRAGGTGLVFFDNIRLYGPG